MDWQSIETAPKDGTKILAWDGRELFCAEFKQLRDGSGFWEIAHTQNGGFVAVYSLTHWMPLPPPPSA